MINDYRIPKTVEDAMVALQEGNAKIIAGGTDLMIDLKAGKLNSEMLVDVTQIEGIKKIEQKGEYLVLGAGTTHQEITESELIQKNAKVLAKACSTVGSLQVRNTATLAGNVVNAQPAADGAVALVALGAEAKIVDTAGESYELIENLYEGLTKSKVDSTSQMVTEIRFPALKDGQGSAYTRWAKREALALPMLCIAVTLSVKKDEVEWIRIAMAPVATKPVRAMEAEAILTGQQPTEEVIQKAADKAVEESNPRDSLVRGSREVRVAVLPNLVKRAIREALENAK